MREWSFWLPYGVAYRTHCRPLGVLHVRRVAPLTYAVRGSKVSEEMLAQQEPEVSAGTKFGLNWEDDRKVREPH